MFRFQQAQILKKIRALEKQTETVERNVVIDDVDEDVEEMEDIVYSEASEEHEQHDETESEMDWTETASSIDEDGMNEDVDTDHEPLDDQVSIISGKSHMGSTQPLNCLFGLTIADRAEKLRTILKKTNYLSHGKMSFLHQNGNIIIVILITASLRLYQEIVITIRGSGQILIHFILSHVIE